MVTRMACKRIAVFAVTSKLGEVGGAERFYDALTDALNARGMQAEKVDVVSDESSFDAIEESYLRFYDFDLSEFDGVISTKAPAFLVRHPNHICYLQHTMRAFYDMFDHEFPRPSKKILQQRALIHDLDSGALRYPRTKKVFVIGTEVRERLRRYNGIEAEVLYQALSLEGLRRNGRYDYVFMPGRLHSWKRVDLVIEAMKHVKAPLVLKISGTGPSEADLKDLAAGDERIRFIGRVSDTELVDLYADALAVPFVPIMEDFGLVALEALASGKPVITCVDSGEPVRLVKDGETGFVCPPNPKAIAKKLEFLYEHPDRAKTMGSSGYRSMRHITWERVSQRLLSALGWD